MPMNDIELCSMSLIKVGAAPITSFDDNTAEAEVAKAIYEPMVEALLVSHPWAFSQAIETLTPEDDNPFEGFANAFRIPNDTLRTISARGQSGANTVYRVVGTLLLSDEAHLTLTYQKRPDTQSFPAHFVQALSARLAAEFCLPLTESASRSEVLQKLASVELRLARLIDSQQSSARAVEDFTLIGVRG